jgi:hypothetical protein
VRQFLITPVFGVPRVAPKASPAHDTRRHPRVTLPVRCWIVSGQHTLYLRLHDLSLGGLSVRAPVPLSASAPIDLRLELPGGQAVRARGEVVWVRGVADSGPRMGARFVEFVEGEELLTHALAGG